MFLEPYTDQIKRLCEDHKVRDLYVFGSAITNEFTEESDIDFVVDFDTDDPLVYADNYFSLKFSLEELLQKKIDLLEHKGLKNKYILQSINESKKLIYES